jgi:hypothetical protein
LEKPVVIMIVYRPEGLGAIVCGNFFEVLFHVHREVNNLSREVYNIIFAGRGVSKGSNPVTRRARPEGLLPASFFAVAMTKRGF